jgi:competence protein ComEA
MQEPPQHLQEAPPPAAGAEISLNAATFEQLREHGLSVTQATRVLAYRERLGGYNSVDDLDEVPGFPGDFLEDFKRRVSV